MQSVISHSVEGTEKLGVELARSLRPGDVLALTGEIGSGKTTFVRGLAQGLGVPASSVASPSFVLVRVYRGRIPLVHADLFRLEGLPEALSVGLEEFYDSDGVMAIEWADKIPGVLPEEFLEVRFEALDPETRRLTWIPHGRRYQMR